MEKENTTQSMSLKHLLKDVPATHVSGTLAKEVRGISYDTRQVKKKYLFICRKGSHTDSHRYISDAIQKGASVIVLEKEIPVPAHITAVYVPDSRKAQALISGNFYVHPDRKLECIGITGTNGKTTTSFFLDKMLQSIGFRVGMIGTVHYRIGEELCEASRTTPESNDLYAMMHKMVQKNISWVIMEVSSHALHLERVYGMQFNSAIFTNLTPEHLDYHNTMEDYFLAKKKLFSELDSSSPAILNADDKYGKKLSNEFQGRIITYGAHKGCTIYMVTYRLFSNSSEALIRTPGGEFNLKIALPGKHNLYNALAALGIGYAYNFDIGGCVNALAALRSVPGRMEFVNTGKPFYVAVDYAHTGDALEKVLQAVRELPVRKIICVFGCGGDRDSAKRPEMGRVSGNIADYTIVTSDNPRTEKPLDIIEQIENGIRKTNGHYDIIPDRKEAIFHALQTAEDNDIVLIAGKGHETTQDFGNRVIHFDDREIVREWAGTGNDK